jgi:hypothetical protein
MFQLAVAGAHLSGLPLNHQLTELGAKLVRTVRTAPVYSRYPIVRALNSIASTATTTTRVHREWMGQVSALAAAMPCLPVPGSAVQQQLPMKQLVNDCGTNFIIVLCRDVQSGTETGLDPPTSWHHRRQHRAGSVGDAY